MEDFVFSKTTSNFALEMIIGMIPELHIEDYNYPLSEDRIAKYPLAERDSSKLLRYVDGKVDEFTFRQLPDLLPADSTIVFNDTKVVPARLHFRRQTGAGIEIFCLQPHSPAEYNQSFAQVASCSWKCVIGNSKRWKGDVLYLYNPTDDPVVAKMNLRATLVSKEGQTGIVEFAWDDGCPFSKVLEVCGSIPIPPYLNRDTEDIDKNRYQTLYARIRGSVAAPTAGLHFTQNVLERLDAKGIKRETVCLHVGAGTFLPVKTSNVAEHHMHREPFSVTKDFLKDIYNTIKGAEKKIVAVGTTSVRTLESLYYAGVDCIEKGAPEDVRQWAPYEREYQYSTEEAIGAIISYLDKNNLDELTIGTKIIIVPGFKFRIVDILVTNFHQPESTLILLVSAFVGGDWKTIYRYALSHDFRFLSYGDSSLLYRRDV